MNKTVESKVRDSAINLIINTLHEKNLRHHERSDGLGYPRGLKTEEIPLLSRIVSVADAYDAMTSDRSYRKALNKRSALDKLIKNKGQQFDPQIVEAFVRFVFSNIKQKIIDKEQIV